MGVGWATARGSLACVAHSVVSIGVVRARFSYFIAVCSQLFPSRPVILNVYVPSVLLSVLPRRGEGEEGGREVSERRGLACFNGNNKLQNTIPKSRRCRKVMVGKRHAV